MGKGIPSLSFASMQKLGSQKSAPFIAKQKPKFTAQDFEKGAQQKGKEIALEFAEYVKDLFRTRKHDYKKIAKSLGLKEKEIDGAELLDGLKTEDGIVFIKKEKLVGKISFREIWYILEYGRKDKGIMPDPVLRKAFSNFQPIYRQRIKKFLKK